MRVCQLVVVSIFLLAVSSVQSPAQQSDLVGTWTSETTAMGVSEGKIIEVPREITFVIEQVHGGLIRGYRTWQAEPPIVPGYVGENLVTEAREPFIGTITSDGKTIRMVEIEDEGMMFCERTGPDEIEFTYLETAPHPVAYTAGFHRVK